MWAVVSERVTLLLPIRQGVCPRWEHDGFLGELLHSKLFNNCKMEQLGEKCFPPMYDILKANSITAPEETLRELQLRPVSGTLEIILLQIKVFALIICKMLWQRECFSSLLFPSTVLAAGLLHWSFQRLPTLAFPLANASEIVSLSANIFLSKGYLGVLTYSWPAGLPKCYSQQAQRGQMGLRELLNLVLAFSPFFSSIFFLCCFVNKKKGTKTLTHIQKRKDHTWLTPCPMERIYILSLYHHFAQLSNFLLIQIQPVKTC